VTGSIITVATLKGGSGKSTLASCLAVHWQLCGRACTIIDADPQSSIQRLAQRGQTLGAVRVVDDATENASLTAKSLAANGSPVIIDTPGFRSPTTLACLATADFVLVPVKPSPLDVDRMVDTLNLLLSQATGRTASFRCVLTQTTRDSIIAKHVRSELVDAGFPVLEQEMTNLVIYPEAALWGATPSMMDPSGSAAREIAAIASEVDRLLDRKQAGGHEKEKPPQSHDHFA